MTYRGAAPNPRFTITGYVRLETGEHPPVLPVVIPLRSCLPLGRTAS